MYIVSCLSGTLFCFGGGGAIPSSKHNSGSENMADEDDRAKKKKGSEFPVIKQEKWELVESIKE